MKYIKKFMSWVWPIIIGLLLAYLLNTFVLSLVRVDGLSMYPNLQNNERVVMLRQSAIKRNSVIVFSAEGVDNKSGVTPTTRYVKRVIGLPGDTIEYRDNGRLYVNGKYSPQNYITKEQQQAGTLSPNDLPKEIKLGTNKKFTVPKGQYFVLGDNREISNDSRYYGFVPRSKILGVVKVPFWDENHELINSYNQ